MTPWRSSKLVLLQVSLLFTHPWAWSGRSELCSTCRSPQSDTNTPHETAAARRAKAPTTAPTHNTKHKLQVISCGWLQVIDLLAAVANSKLARGNATWLTDMRNVHMDVILKLLKPSIGMELMFSAFCSDIFSDTTNTCEDHVSISHICIWVCICVYILCFM